MRTLTTAQQREITSPASVKVGFDLSGFEYITTPDVGSTYGYFSPMLDVSSYSSEIGWLGGIGAISDLDININNSELESNYLNASYLNYKSFTMKLIVNDTSYDLYEGIIEDYTIDNDNMALNGVDNAGLYNVDLLEPVPNDDVPEDSNQSFYPICYFTYGDGKYIIPFPMVNLLNGSNKYVVGNHPTPTLSDSPYIYQYANSMGEYLRFQQRMPANNMVVEPATTRINDIRGIVGNLLHVPNSYYRNASIGQQNTHSGDMSNIFDKDDTNYITMGASENVSIKFDLEDLGEIRNVNDVFIFIQTSNRSGTVNAAMIDSGGVARFSTAINADSFQYQNWGAKSGLWTFNELSSTYETSIQTAAASGCRVYFIELYIDEFYFYRVKRVPLNVIGVTR